MWTKHYLGGRRKVCPLPWGWSLELVVWTIMLQKSQNLSCWTTARAVSRFPLHDGLSLVSSCHCSWLSCRWISTSHSSAGTSKSVLHICQRTYLHFPVVCLRIRDFSDRKILQRLDCSGLFFLPVIFKKFRVYFRGSIRESMWTFGRLRLQERVLGGGQCSENCISTCWRPSELSVHSNAVEINVEWWTPPASEEGSAIYTGSFSVVRNFDRNSGDLRDGLERLLVAWRTQEVQPRYSIGIVCPS